ncbi:MAG: FAD-dependent oxidoreductase [Acholeplasmataceae bacterium]|nr:FAD-dependent oxidoreductase [Acholeplasmataceae bacterium]
MKKVIIIGYGPAGISAAIYLKRAGVNPLVIGKDLGALDDYDDLIENYYGFSKPISGKKLILEGIEQAKNLGVEIMTDSVISIQQNGSSFIVQTSSDAFETKSILLTTGKKRMTMNIPGFSKYRGKGISMCATCDGYFYRKKKVAIVGCGSYMQHELEHLNRLSKDVLVFTHGNNLENPVHNEVVTDQIIRFNGEEKLTSIQTDKAVYPIDGVFIALGTPSSVEFASQLGVIVEKNNLIVDETYQTNIEGLFAAGDIIGGKLQIAKAVYDGMQAADAIQTFLKR